MAIKPILFNAEMVKAILDGRKTQTRRIIKGIPLHDPYFEVYDGVPLCCDDNGLWHQLREFSHIQKDDILWVRETWCKWWMPHGEWHYCYKASERNGNMRPTGPEYDDAWETIPWKPSIHMPKEAARLFLRVTDIRAERLHDMTDRDAEKEGIGNLYLEDVGFGDKDYGCISYVDSKGYIGLQVEQFAHLWDSTIKKDKIHRYGWEANPWVWVIEFEQTEQKTPF